MSSPSPLCPHCEEPWNEEFRHCRSCGGVRSAEGVIIGRICLRCGAEEGSLHPFCGSCGSRFADPPRSSLTIEAVPPEAAESKPGAHLIRTVTQPQPGFVPIPRIDEPGAALVRTRSSLAFDLPREFRYLRSHAAAGAGMPSFGNEDCIAALLERLRYSDGGACLVTGYRGVGKTTLVSEALRRFKAATPGVLAVWLKVPQPLSTVDLLYEVIRRLFEVMQDEGVLAKLAPEIARKLVLAYARASMAIKNGRADASAAPRQGELAVASALITKLGLGVALDQRLSVLEEAAVETGFLEYRATDVEHDLKRILELLATAPVTGDSGGVWPFSRRRIQAGGYRVVVVLDELDQLTASEHGKAAFEALLSGLKRVLAAQHVHFVLVGGVDLYQAYYADVVRGNSLYESVFAFQLYVPCNLTGAEQLLQALGATPEKLGEREHRILLQYLLYTARGITRRLLHELNNLVRFGDNDVPRIAISDTGFRRMELLDELESRLKPFLSRERSGLFSSRLHDDTRLLGSHYLVDWLLSRREKVFTLDEAVEWQSGEAVDPQLRLSGAELGELFRHLVEAKIIARVEKVAAHQTLRGQDFGARPAVYVLSSWVREQLFMASDASELAASGPASRASVEPPPFRESAILPAPSRSFRSRDLDVGVVIRDRYELRALVGQGGVGGVFRAWDRRLGCDVAIKYLLDSRLQPDVLKRFVREAHILQQLRSPHIVTCHALLTDEAGIPLMVLDFLEGRTLRQALEEQSIWPLDAVLDLGIALASALEVIEDAGVSRIDLKPENVMLTGESERPVLVDFGIASQADASQLAITSQGATLGTPLYLAPEQAQSAAGIDVRSDIWSLGMVLAEMLLGRHPVEGAHTMTVVALMQVLREQDLTLDELEAPPLVTRVLLRALHRDRSQRYQSAKALRAALERLQRQLSSGSLSGPITLDGEETADDAGAAETESVA